MKLTILTLGAAGLLLADPALADGKILTPASRQAMFTDYGHKYGYGWQVQTIDGHEQVGHSGGINGFSTGIARYPKDGVVAIVLANYNATPSNGIAENLAGLCVGTRKAEGEHPARGDPRPLCRRLCPVADLHPDHQPPGRPVDQPGHEQGPVPIYPTAPGEFFAKIVNAQMSFTQTGDAPAKALVLHQGGRNRTAPRAEVK